MDKLIVENLQIDFLSQQITSNDEEVKLDPKAFKTLTYLIEKKHRVVTSDELIEKVWDNRLINNDVVVSAIGRIRKLFKDAGIEQEAIHTVHKVGYRFTLDLSQTKQASLSQSINNIDTLKKINWFLFVITLVLGAFLVKYNFFDENIPVKNNEFKYTQNNETITSKVNKQPTEIFFLRHAEKLFDGTDDPHLSEQGKKRAAYWKEFLSDIKFDEVYSTRFYRNLETADIVLNGNKNVIIYSALSFEIIEQIKKIKGKKVLIIGHSNTIPDMVNRIVGHNKYPPMSHKNYNLIYQVNIDSSGYVNSNQYVVKMAQ